MFGKTLLHYRRHFMVLLGSLTFKTFEEFKEGFHGMTCDFSDAERAGFERARKYAVVIRKPIDGSIGIFTHLMPSIFPAKSAKFNPVLSYDTNAQESLGADYKRTAEKKMLSILEAMDHTHRYMSRIEIDYSTAIQGGPIRYNRKGKKTNENKYFNDGRAPDTTDSLIGSKSKSRPSSHTKSRSKSDVQPIGRPS
ncbi:hypothetical protein BGZ65_001212, partial [Modicella reniformis]